MPHFWTGPCRTLGPAITCPLYHVRRKDRRHPLACPRSRLNQICPILTALQERWAFGLMREVAEVTGAPPMPSDNARIEQVIRHRSRIFQIENYLKIAGLLDLKKGEVRNVGERLNTTENALSRTLAEFRQALADRRAVRQTPGPRLEEYLLSVESVGPPNPDAPTRIPDKEEGEAP